MKQLPHVRQRGAIVSTSSELTIFFFSENTHFFFSSSLFVSPSLLFELRYLRHSKVGGRKCLFGLPVKPPYLACPIFDLGSLSPDGSAQGETPRLPGRVGEVRTEGRRGEDGLLSLREEENRPPLPLAAGEGQSGGRQGRQTQFYLQPGKGDCGLLQPHLQGRAVGPGSVCVPPRRSGDVTSKPGIPL